jgi:hypothetical protein
VSDDFTEIICPSCKGIDSRYCRACDGMGTTYVRTDALHRFDDDLKFTTTTKEITS